LRQIQRVDDIPASFFDKLEFELKILLDAKDKEIVELRSRVIEAQKATVAANDAFIQLQKHARSIYDTHVPHRTTPAPGRKSRHPLPSNQSF